MTDAWLARRCAAPSQVAPEVAWAWRRIAVGRGMVRIEHLAAELGWSRKRLWSRFQSQIGLPPKRAAKLIRFDHAVHGLVAAQADGPGAGRRLRRGGNLADAVGPRLSGRRGSIPLAGI